MPRSETPSFATRYEKLAPALYVWITLHLGPLLRRRLDPEDLHQEVWCRAFQGHDKYDPERASFRSWVFGIAQHVLMEELRRTIRGIDDPQKPEFVSWSRSFDSLPAELTSVSARVARRETTQKLLDLAENLSPCDRKVFLYRGLEGLSFEEVAQRCGMDKEAVRSRWRRLRRRLAVKLW